MYQTLKEMLRQQEAINQLESRVGGQLYQYFKEYPRHHHRGTLYAFSYTHPTNPAIGMSISVNRDHEQSHLIDPTSLTGRRGGAYWEWRVVGPSMPREVSGKAHTVEIAMYQGVDAMITRLTGMGVIEGPVFDMVDWLEGEMVMDRLKG